MPGQRPLAPLRRARLIVVAAPSGDSPPLKRSLGLIDVVLMIVAGLVSVNTMAPIAANGPMVLWVWPVAFVLFFLPQGITVIELSQHYPGEGAVYVWPSKLLGDLHGFLSGWCYWMANIVYVPTLAISSVGLAAYMFGISGPTLAGHDGAIESGALALLALLIWLNIRGLKAEKRLVNAAALGTLLVVAALIGFAAWVALREGGGVHILAPHPRRFDWHFLAVFGLVCFSLLGLEIASNVGGEIREPRVTLPRGLLIGALLVACMDVLLTVAMLLAIPSDRMGIVQGVLEAVESLSHRLGLTYLPPTVAALLSLSVAGTAAAWLAAPARIPYVAALEGYLPRAFARLHPRYASPHVALLFCGALCALAVMMSFAKAGLNEAFTTILDLSVILSLVQYLYMYSSLLALVLRRREVELYFNRAVLAAAGVCGFATTLVGTALAFVPTTEVEHTGLFELKLGAFCAAILGAGALCFRLNARGRRARSP